MATTNIAGNIGIKPKKRTLEMKVRKTMNVFPTFLYTNIKKCFININLYINIYAF